MSDTPLVRTLAAIVAFSFPLFFYLFADAYDAFPGVLAIERTQDDSPAGIPAEGESWDTAPAERLAPSGEATAHLNGAELSAAIDPVAKRPSVKGRYAYSIVDAATGEEIAQHGADTARTPASTMKLLTALSAVRTLGSDRTFDTVTTFDGKTLFLVGHGDMLLSTHEKETKEGVARASLADLADQTAQQLKANNAHEVTLAVDDSYFAHEPINPAWGDNGPSGGWVAPIMPLGVDGGRLDGEEYGPKSTDPALDAGKAFAALLHERGITVTSDVSRGTSTDGAHTLGTVTSAPLHDLIEHMLLYSDNTVAELLARLTAKEKGLPANVAGAQQAVTEDVAEIAEAQGVSIDGLAIHDNSGLARSNAISPTLLAHLNAWACGEAPDDIRDVFALVPVAGLSGTLTDRFDDPDEAAARGVVHGKTGSLASVSSLSGTAVLTDGRIVGYSFLVYGFESGNVLEARSAVDAMAAQMVSVGIPAPQNTEPSSQASDSTESPTP